MADSIPAETVIGHVHLKVSDLDRAEAFYRDVLGFEVTTRYSDHASFLSAGGYHHHLGLNVWHSRGAPPAPVNHPGLYHFAILYPSRKDLANALKRVMERGVAISGAADHSVSEAIYLNDPDGNGIELYRDRPREEWRHEPDGSLHMTVEPLDLDTLLAEAD